MVDDVVMKGVEEEINRIVQDVADFVFTKSQDNLIEAGKVDTGFLLKTANVNRGFMEAKIVYPAVYADSVHDGTPAGNRPNEEAIKKWVMRKLGVKKQSLAWALAVTISDNIEERGIPAFPFLENAVESAVQRFGVERR